MSDIPFHTTRMGHRFFESTVPNLVQELSQLNKMLARILAVLERQSEPEAGISHRSSVPDEDAR